MSKKVKILFFSASPKGWEEVEAGKEFRKIFEKHNDKQVQLLSVSNTKINDLYDVLLKNKPDIAHFSGHGDLDEILLENAEKTGLGFSKDALTELFLKLPKRPKLLFLNACWTALNIAKLRQTIDIIVASPEAVPENTASIFADRFYSSLFSEGTNVKTAFDLAKSYVKATESKDDIEMYKLFTRQPEFERTVFFQETEDIETPSSTPNNKFNIQIGTMKSKNTTIIPGDNNIIKIKN